MIPSAEGDSDGLPWLLLLAMILTYEVRTMVGTNKTRGTLSREMAGALSSLAAEGRSVFTVEDFARAARRAKRNTYRVLNHLVKAGWIGRLARGKYLIVPLAAGPESAWTEDSLIVGCHLASPAAVAYWSACHYWNWTEQVPRTVFVQTTQKKMRYAQTVLGVNYRLVRIRAGKFFGTARRATGQGRFTVTDREKTLVDALDHPELCGGIRQVMEMLPSADAINWDKVNAYLERMNSGAIYKRLGLLVERLGSRVRLRDRQVRLRTWRSRLTGGYAPLEPGGRAAGPIDSRWRVRLNVPGVIRNEDVP